jgi:hypothetical protein
MPSLEGIPSEYLLGFDSLNVLHLAKHLLEAGIISSEGFDPRDVASYLSKALNEVVKMAFKQVKAVFEVTVFEDEDRFVLELTSREVVIYDDGNAFRWLTKIHPLAPRLLLDELKDAQGEGRIYDPACAYAQISAWAWQGGDEDTAIIEELKHELAHSRGVEPDTITDEDARAVANAQQLYTNEYVDQHLPMTLRSWLNPLDRLTLEPLLLAHPKAKRWLSEIRAIKTLSESLPEWSYQMLRTTDLNDSFAYVLTLPGEKSNCVLEQYFEYDDIIAQAGEWLPSFALELLPDGTGITEFKRFLEVVPQMLERTERLLGELEGKQPNEKQVSRKEDHDRPRQP